MIKKVFSAFLLAGLLVSQLALPSAVLADGMLIVRPDPYASRWDFSPETNQQAFINHEDGLQKMIISIGIEDQAKKGAVWLFPVPSAPEKVNIDVLVQIPELRGEEVGQKAEMVLNGLKEITDSSQIYPFLLSGFGSSLMTTALISDGDGFSGGMRGNGVEVYKHIEKEGMISEVITTRSAEGLNNYLKSKGLDINAGSVPVLDNYIGKDYSFVVSWMVPPEEVVKKTPAEEDSTDAEAIKRNLYKYISQPDVYKKFAVFYNGKILNYIKTWTPPPISITETRDKILNDPEYAVYFFLNTSAGADSRNWIIRAIQNDPTLINIYPEEELPIEKKPSNQKGVYVVFPTEKIYFPLIPTSVYGDKVVPASIRVLGHVSPKVYEGIKENTKVKYFNLGYLTGDGSLKDFFGRKTASCGTIGETSFMNCSINYTKIDISAPSKSFTEDLWMNDVPPLKVGLPNFIIEQRWFLGFMMLAIISVLAGILSGWAVFEEHRNMNGVKKFGFLGLFNFFTIIGLWIAMNFTRTKEGVKEAEAAIMEVKRKNYYNKIMIGSFLRYLCLPFLIPVILIAPVLIMYLVSLVIGKLSHNDIFVPVFLAVLSAVLAVSYRLKKVRKEDQPLFDWLKYCKYSNSTFVPEDGRKTGFIFLYSVSFLLISWIAFRMLIIAVNM